MFHSSTLKKNWFLKFKDMTKKEKPVSSPFSDFFRKASSGERKKIFKKAAIDASRSQRAYFSK